jgi:hypothetical protein
MDTIIRSRHGYREKKVRVEQQPSSSLWDAVQKEEKTKKRKDFWKLVAAVILLVFAAVLMLRQEFVKAVRNGLGADQTTESRE